MRKTQLWGRCPTDRRAKLDPRHPSRGLTLVALLALTTPALATDHDNIDAGRPLRFDDAESIAYRELAFEFGLGLNSPRRRPVGLDGQVELLYGFARDSHLEFGFAPRLGGHARSNETGFEFGDLDLGLFHQFRREIRNAPALAAKVEASIPTESGESTRLRLRGIATKTVRQYDRLHLNLDAELVPNARAGERSTVLGAVLGYSRPLGYPTEFNTTGVAELALRQGERNGEGTTVSAGVGFRRQISPRSVVDFGVQSDLSAPRGAASTPLRLVAGYSTSF
jgi:hypothetical protein